MKKVINVFLSLCFFCCYTSSFAQHKNVVKYYDINWETALPREAYYLSVLEKVDDTLYKKWVYKNDRPCIKMETYKDAGCNTLHGSSVYYNQNGYADSSMEFKEGKLHGRMCYFNDKGKIISEKEFYNGEFVHLITAEELKRNHDRNKDSLKNMEQVPSEYMGGVDAWKQFLMSNIQYPKEAARKEIQGTVVAQFEVLKNGEVSNVNIFKSVEYTLDQEAMRLIKKSKGWVPAKLNGEDHLAWFRQPISFRLH